MFKLRTHTYLFLFTLPAWLFAQEKLVGPCAEKSFNFWIGEWNLTWPAEQFAEKKGTLGIGS